MSLFLTTVFVFGFVMFIMAIGVMLGNKRIEGSCGGLGGCDFCFFKNGRNCDGNSACEDNAAQPGTGEPGGCNAPCLIEESPGDTGK